MRIILTFDYELFFGGSTGTPQKCLVEPCRQLIKIADTFKIKFVFFVDSGYLHRLRQLQARFHTLREEYTLVSDHVKQLAVKGHDIQLHIHPHWQDANYTGSAWRLDTSRYKLSDFSSSDIQNIVISYKDILEEITHTHVFAFRAGGWCIQPFASMRSALLRNGIWLDSTVYRNGMSESETHYFDFRNAPDKSWWRFSDNPIIEDTKGEFLEVPISSISVSPLFFWKLGMNRLIKSKKHSSFGDGQGIGMSFGNKFRRMVAPSHIAVSTDSVHAGMLEKSIKLYSKRFSDNDFFISIGHPKMCSTYSLTALKRFIEENISKHHFSTFQEYF